MSAVRTAAYRVGCLALVGVLAVSSGCGTDTQTAAIASSTAHGTLIDNPPPRLASLSASALQRQLDASSAGRQLLGLTGTPGCGVAVYYIRYWTVGSAGKAIQDSGALMVPTGAAPACSGPQPMLLYAHGTQITRDANIADINDASDSEGTLIAAMFAAHGFIVVAPNYAGYDTSTLPYHPYLQAAEQSADMIDALAAARTALPRTFASSTRDNHQLFVTGYSEGGYVAMATVRALQSNGATVTASVPMSGPYALEALGDSVFRGHVNLGATVFAPLLTTGYQHEYGDIYTATTDIYSPTYAAGIATLLPSRAPIGTLFAEGKLPRTALFDSTTPTVTVPGDPTLSSELTAQLQVPRGSANALFAAGFGSPALITNTYRVSYALDAAKDPDGVFSTPPSSSLAAAEPTQPLRRAFYLNDMRYGSWAPASPMLLCGGDQDPTVFFGVDTGTMQSFWSRLPAGVVTVLDVSATPSGEFAEVQSAFQQSQRRQLAYFESAAGGGLSATAAQQRLLEGYHVAVAPFCALAARSFMERFVSRP